MADLSEKVTQEQQQYIRAQWADAQDAERFRYMDPRVEAQVQVSSSFLYHRENCVGASSTLENNHKGAC
jgi:hypothetical protein